MNPLPPLGSAPADKVGYNLGTLSIKKNMTNIHIAYTKNKSYKPP